jgi:hypothetical protein
MLGFITNRFDLVPRRSMEASILKRIPKGTEELNMGAFQAGWDLADGKKPRIPKKGSKGKRKEGKKKEGKKKEGKKKEGKKKEGKKEAKGKKREGKKQSKAKGEAKGKKKGGGK